jgi:xylose isomerase
MPKMAIIAGFLGKTKDRFHEYNQALDLEGKFRSLSEIQGYDGLEVVYPYEVNDPQQVRELMQRYGVEIAAVNVNVKGEPEFKSGGVSSPDPATRRKAVRFIKEAKDFASEIGADKVTCCPLADGYEFSFQVDYREYWDNLVASFREAGRYREDMPLFIEYKPSETRAKCFVNDAAKTILLLNEVDAPNMGVTLDFGHSVYGEEHPAEALMMIHHSPYRLYVHVNDNNGKWDWDFFCGSRHMIEYMEFIYYLRRIGYDDYLTSDTSPTRLAIAETFEANSRVTNKLWNLFDRVDTKELERLIHGSDYLATWRFVEEQLFGLT